MSDKKDRFFLPPLGASSLLAAFAVLCLVVFALLGLSTVRADQRLSDASLQATEDYYAADCQAQEILARLRNGEVPEGVQMAATGLNYFETYALYAVPISDTQELQVTVLVENELTGETWRVLRWQAVPTEEWVGDDVLDLWDGGANGTHHFT